MEEVSKGIVLTAMKYEADGREMMGMIYRAYDNIELANKVIKPFIDNRRAFHSRELNAFEAELDPQDARDTDYVAGHARALQDYEALPWWKRLMTIRPIRPTDEQVNTWKRVTDKRTELSNLSANPLMNLVAEDGTAMIKDLIQGWEKVGFKVTSKQEESNAEYHKTTIKLEYGS